MTIIARRIASTPARTAVETWDRIVSLISRGGSKAGTELNSVCGLAASVIANEVLKDAPIVIFGSGPRLRIYCVYGEDAITGENCHEDDLTWDPTAGSWQLHLPCRKEDVEWIREALKGRSGNIFVYNMDQGISEEGEQETDSMAGGQLSVNLGGFLKK